MNAKKIIISQKNNIIQFRDLKKASVRVLYEGKGQEETGTVNDTSSSVGVQTYSESGNTSSASDTTDATSVIKIKAEDSLMIKMLGEEPE